LQEAERESEKSEKRGEEIDSLPCCFFPFSSFLLLLEVLRVIGRRFESLNFSLCLLRGVRKEKKLKERKDLTMIRRHCIGIN